MKIGEVYEHAGPCRAEKVLLTYLMGKAHQARDLCHSSLRLIGAVSDSKEIELQLADAVSALNKCMDRIGKRKRRVMK